MKIELAVITTEFLRSFVEKATKGLNDEITFHLYVYNDFNELADIYCSIPKHVRGIVVSGGHLEKIILNKFPNDGHIIEAFNNDDGALYKQFLGLFHTYPDLTPERIFVDLFDILNIPVAEYLYGEEMVNWLQYSEKYFKTLSLQDMIDTEADLYQRHLKLWRENLVDVSLTRFSSLVPKLSNQGVNIHFLYPSITYVQEVCRNVVKQIKILTLQENQSGAIIVTADKSYGNTLTKEQLDDLHMKLTQYIKAFDIDAFICAATYGFEILTTRHIIEKITNNLQVCGIQRYLRRELDFPVAVGYGLGLTLQQARLNSMDANREAMLHTHTSYIVNALDELIGPLGSKHALTIPRKLTLKVQAIAQKTQLSSLTIQKIISAIEASEDGQITSTNLAQRLSITNRSANRFLSNLLNNGELEIAGQRRATTKGRPERLYRLTDA